MGLRLFRARVIAAQLAEVLPKAVGWGWGLGVTAAVAAGFASAPTQPPGDNLLFDVGLVSLLLGLLPGMAIHARVERAIRERATVQRIADKLIERRPEIGAFTLAEVNTLLALIDRREGRGSVDLLSRSWGRVRAESRSLRRGVAPWLAMRRAHRMAWVVARMPKLAQALAADARAAMDARAALLDYQALALGLVGKPFSELLSRVDGGEGKMLSILALASAPTAQRPRRYFADDAEARQIRQGGVAKLVRQLDTMPAEARETAVELLQLAHWAPAVHVGLAGAEALVAMASELSAEQRELAVALLRGWDGTVQTLDTTVRSI